ncbi:CHASE2 domain-containing protein [Noviherbaspirillum pedocola]|uniref:CHASE2 domain-containing protein n=1 Tax=Noviherbaspirillum pedocola TaxID=2801341 RepID=A0A934SUL5_9BURK|nr:CHASE2 domain-containing protein [Noviherbaspirillum pedocola]MBK4733112.1 CHASE2 domain-containing protein [Noviherbaspirillum pedocola]
MNRDSLRGVLRQLVSLFFSESVAHALRGSVLVAMMLLFLNSTGAWKYFESTVRAHEFGRSAAETHSVDGARLPLVILVDDAGYERFFDGKSPVDRARMTTLLQTIAAHTRPDARVLIDIDLSPAPGQARGQAQLERLLRGAPGKWVLPAVRSANPDAAAQNAAWRATLCAAGVDFGLPYLPNEFGYPKLTHQYAGSLADVAAARGACVDPQQPFAQKAMPLSPLALKSGMVIPFSGDLEALGDMLDMLRPTSIVLGGAWGQADIFASPFGDRFGAQVHAAALAGAETGQRLAPRWMEVLLSWTFVSVLSTLLIYATRFLATHTGEGHAWLVGHAFFALRVQPVLLLAVVVAAFLGLSEVIAMVQSRSGLWIDDTRLAAYLMVWFFITIDAGRRMPPACKNWRSVVHDYITSPPLADVKSVAESWRVLFAPAPEAGGLSISRRRAAFEGACALVSLTMQSILPAASLMFLLYHSLLQAL